MTRACWHAFSYENKTATMPPPSLHNTLLWVMEEWGAGVTLGYFDGFTWRTWTGSDDCSVSHWMPVEYPAAP